jgi:hypothetical protein
MIAGASVGLESLPGIAAPLNRKSETSNTDASASGQNPVAASPEIPGEFTRGIGVYPGNPLEDFSPRLVSDATTYRNLALKRPAYHSSSYDYNLTAQLVTDGIKDTRLPSWMATATSSRGLIGRDEREVIVDHAPTSAEELRGPRAWVQVQIGGSESVPSVDRVDLIVLVRGHVSAADLSFAVSASDDGRVWKTVGSVTSPQLAPTAGYPPDFVSSGQLFTPSIRLNSEVSSRFYRIECGDSHPPEEHGPGVMWSLGEAKFFHSDQRVEVGGPYDFTSAWMSEGLGEEWVYVDLGARCQFDRITLSWICRAAEGIVQVSDDTEHWHDLQALTGTGLVDDIKLASPVQGRYVRVWMTRPSSPFGYILSEVEVYGRGGSIAQAHPAPPPDADGKLRLAGGRWRLQRDSLTKGTGETLSKAGFKDDDWVVATVPGTVLTSYLNVGAIPDPNYGQNQLYISDTFFYADFWYRTEFEASELSKGKLAWLNFDGINWKAEVYLNGEKLGRIEGGFMRGRFDVTSKLLRGQPNALAVRIEKNATPGSVKQKTIESPAKNGGALGADNPTFHASIGWDWIPTIRGRNIGIWDEVSLTVSGPVTIENPFVSTTLPLPDTSQADVAIEVELVNYQSKRVEGTLRGRFGDAQFEQPVTLAGGARSTVKLDSSKHPTLHLKNPQLWWPAGYGDPHLYPVELTFEVRGHGVSDRKTMQAGVRQMSASEEGDALKLWVNGRRFVARGGNWGFSESMLRFRAREYDAALRYHREMNFTMVRNWVGQIGGDAFYEACDRHGIMVWQDFWLANPWDGPEPDDNAMFLANAKDLLLRIRNHPSIGIYCGRNEGFPPPPLEQGLRALLTDLHPGLHYIPSSADVVVSGHGPYRAMPLDFYFTEGADSKLHSEMGCPNVPSIESVRATMPDNEIWPRGLDWALHDYCLQGAQAAASFNSTIDHGYGGADNLEDWIALAQFLDYELYRAMFEGQSKYRMGLLLWMSHSCWPSFVWTTYDYYLEAGAAYFGSKKGSEPLHIQWNRSSETIEVVNYSAGNQKGLTASVEVLNLDGSKVWQKSASLDSVEDSTNACILMEYPAGLTPVHFVRLALQRGSEVFSTNFYLRSVEEGNYRAIRTLPKVRLQAGTTSERQGAIWRLRTEVSNPTSNPALMVRLKAVREKTRDRILPAIYSDNYIELMPGERRVIETELNHADTRGESPQIEIGGFNVVA